MNTYLIVSDCIYFINKKCDELKNGITNIVTFNMDENTIDEVLEELSYISMFDDKKCIIVKNVKSFSSKSKDDEKILNYLENENKNTILIFIANNIDQKRKVVKVLKDNNRLFIYPNLTKTEQKNKLREIIEEKGYSIDDNTLWYIINNSLGNFDLEISEINKIMLYYDKPTSIKYDDVVHITSSTIDENNFKLVDAIIKKDLNSSLIGIRELKTLKVDPSIIIALIYREFKLMLQVYLYEQNKINHRDLLNVLKIQEWQYDKIKNNLRIYNIEKIKEEIVNIANLDYKLKSGFIGKDVVLDEYLISLCN